MVIGTSFYFLEVKVTLERSEAVDKIGPSVLGPCVILYALCPNVFFVLSGLLPILYSMREM